MLRTPKWQGSRPNGLYSDGIGACLFLSRYIENVMQYIVIAHQAKASGRFSIGQSWRKFWPQCWGQKQFVCCSAFMALLKSANALRCCLMLLRV